MFRYGKSVARKSCHSFSSTAQVGLIQALAIMSDNPVRIVDAKPPTTGEINLLSNISVVRFGISVLAFISVVIAASFVAAKTRLPGRFSVLASMLVLPAWWIFEQSTGGSLEMTFGPEAHLATLIVYASFAVLFSFGFVCMCAYLLKKSPTAKYDA